MNYYQTLLNEIDELIQNKNYTKAHELIVQELKVAYVPKDVLEQLEKYLSIIPIQLNLNSVGIKEIENWLLGDDSLLAYEAINYLNDLNLNNFLDEISEWLKIIDNRYLIGLLILVLIKQNINCNFTFKRDGMSIEFNPFYLEYPNEWDSFKMISDKLSLICSHNVNLSKIAFETLTLESIMILPFDFDVMECDLYVDAIIGYAYKLLNLDIEYAQLLQKGIVNEAIISLFSTQ